MMRYSSITIVSALTGFLGGVTAVRLIPAAVLAQGGPQKTIRAERIELVTKYGKTVAEFGIKYDSFVPSGSPHITLTATYKNYEGKLSITPARTLMSAGDHTALISPDGGMSLQSPRGLITVGHDLGLGPDSVSVMSKAGMSKMTATGIRLSDADGTLRSSLEYLSFAGEAKSPSLRFFGKDNLARIWLHILPDGTGTIILGDSAGPGWHVMASQR